MNVTFLGWQNNGNADNVCVIVEMPCGKDIYPELLLDQKALVLYGRRNGKLRCKVIQYLDCLDVKWKYIDKGKYRDHLHLYKEPIFDKVREQVEKHYTWNLVSL